MLCCWFLCDTDYIGCMAITSYHNLEDLVATLLNLACLCMTHMSHSLTEIILIVVFTKQVFSDHIYPASRLVI